MRFFLTIASFCILLGNGCSSPTDIDAWRNKIPENPDPESTAAIKISTKYLDFGYITQNTSFSIDLPIYNISTVDTVKIRSVALVSGRRGFKLPLLDSLPVFLLPGRRTPVNSILVEFNPRTGGEVMDTLFVNGDRNNFTILRGVSGTGTTRSSVEIKNTDFGNVPVGTTKDETTEIKNTDGEALFVTIEQLPSVNEPFVIITPPGEYKINPGESRPFTVRFSPKERKTEERLMKFYIRIATGRLNSTFTVTGTGI